ncbi:hypothetical protein ACFQX4_11910 [Roseomonas sp. GCM10028921]
MRAPILSLLAIPALCLGLAADAGAQTTFQAPSRPAEQPSAVNPNPHTATPQAPDMQTYVGMLQRASRELRQEISRAEGGARPTQPGAASPDTIQLMQKTRDAWQVAERAPQPLSGMPVYDNTMRDMKQRFADIVHSHPALPHGETLNAARGVLQSLETLEQAATTGSPRPS